MQQITQSIDMQIAQISDGSKSCFRSAYRMELYKIRKRKDTWLLLSIALVPLIFAFGYSFGGSAFSFTGEKMDAVTYLSQMVYMGISLFVFLFFYAIYTARTYATEIERNYLLLYVPRVHNRNCLYHAKIMALYTILFAAFIITLAVGLLSYYCVLVPYCPRIVTGELYQSQNLWRNIGLCIASLITYSVTIQVVMCLCSYVKFLPAIVIYLGFFFAWQMVIYVPILQYCSPYFYMSEFLKTDEDMSKLGLSLPSLPLSVLVPESILFLIVFWFIASFIGTKKFQHIDLA